MGEEAEEDVCTHRRPRAEGRVLKPLDQAAREALVMELFWRGKLSIGKASKLLSQDRAAFARRASELDIQYS